MQGARGVGKEQGWGGRWQEVMAEMGKRPNLKYIVDTKPVRQR